MPTSYVALDLETTGLDPHRDEIIEVGAVKFQGAEVIDTFQTFVKPRQALPAAIQLLTGISPDDLKGAPPFAAVAGDLLLFLGDSTIVGQNIAFDLSFLANQGMELPNPVGDTLQLAKILAPYLIERNLTALTNHFDVAYSVKHRAVEDSIAAQGVFLALRERAIALHPTIINTLLRLGSSSGWGLTPFFQKVLEKQQSGGAANGATAIEKAPEPTVVKIHESLTDYRPTKAKQAKGIDIEWLSTLLGPDGGLARAFLDYEHRPEQVEMLKAAAQALQDKQHLLVEAGTGTGKSLAYLLPSLVQAMSTGSPVVVSTHTLALQDQLLSKDIPLALQALQAGIESSDNDPIGLPLEQVRYAQLKGRSNYLCLRRWQTVLQGTSESIDPDFLARITVWLNTTQTGDRTELGLNQRDGVAWARLSAEQDNCPPNQCLAMRGGDCFLHQARQKAQEAHLLVVNHALLISDLKAGNTLLPGHQHLVIDEAHHLEEVATDQLGFRTRIWDFQHYLERYYQEPGGRPQGLIAQIESAFNTSGPLFQTRVQGQRLAAAKEALPGARRRMEQLFDLLTQFVRSNGEGSAEYNRRVRLTSGPRRQEPWSEIEQAWEELRLVLESLQNDLEYLKGPLEIQAQVQLEPFSDLLAETVALHFMGARLLEQGTTVIGRADPQWVTWLAGESNGEGVSMYAAPLSVGPMLQKDLFGKLESVVLTSATLQVGPDFTYMKSQLGLESPEELVVASPFPYRRNAQLIVPQDMPDPSSGEHPRRLEEALIDLCTASEGRALALFTSHAALQRAYRGISGALEAEGLQVLAQGINGNPQQLLERFRTQPRSILLGTSSFWEGVDVVGDALSLLIITRLPFPVPSDPVFAARSECFDDPFGGYTVPQAVLRFRQGFGRLIRSKRDRGVAVILDQRVLTKSYGNAFLHSLPPANVRRCMTREAAELTAEWLDATQT